MTKRPPLNLQVTTLWDYPSQQYGSGGQGDQNYQRRDAELRDLELPQTATPSRADLVVDPVLRKRHDAQTSRGTSIAGRSATT